MHQLELELLVVPLIRVGMQAKMIIRWIHKILCLLGFCLGRTCFHERAQIWVLTASFEIAEDFALRLI